MDLIAKKKSMLVAIHQPNFFPWLGYFNKIARADIFVILDNAQFPKTGGTWINRVKLLNNGNAKWVTMPIVRAYHGLVAINEIKIHDSTPWRKKLIGTINADYSKCPFYKSVYDVLAPLVEYATDDLAKYNLNAIYSICRALGLDTDKIRLGSTLKNVNGKSTEMLIEIVRSVGGTAYMYGAGAAGYQEDYKFGESDIELVSQSYRHPVYKQHNNKGDFVAGLSIIDALMNCGFDGVSKMLSLGYRNDNT